MKIKRNATMILMMIMLTGCGDMVEIEDRDFVLTMGITAQNNEYKVIYVRPDLSVLTGQPAPEENELDFSISGQSLTQIEEKYSLESNKRLDYSHLKAIILDENIAHDNEKMLEFLKYVEDNYEISRNTPVYLTLNNLEDVIEINKSISGSVGEYLDSLYTNNRRTKEYSTHTIADLINNMNMMDKVSIVPIVEKKNEYVVINGVGLFSQNTYKKMVAQENCVYIDIANGAGEGCNINLPSGNYVRLNEIKKKIHFSRREMKPYVLLQITGTAKLEETNENIHSDMTEVSKETIQKEKIQRETIQKEKTQTEEKQKELNNYIKNNIITNIETIMKRSNIDFLNLYRMSATRDRKTWMLYQDKHTEFNSDVLIGVVVDFKIK